MQLKIAPFGKKKKKMKKKIKNVLFVKCFFLHKSKSTSILSMFGEAKEPFSL
jgi:hypothetical protein